MNGCRACGAPDHPSGCAQDVQRVVLTSQGAAMVEEMGYGHNPMAYLCSERPDGQEFHSDSVCVICGDGFEAIHWKRRALGLRSALKRLADRMEHAPLSERDAGQVSERTEAFCDAAAMVRVTLRDTP